ncbi:hypothetical protein TNIN_51911 [Trichonephila inaurata madagascariensis]|uniref:Uncharacterized protein n=1 Tax=Trichonephila inaurata madagascariensis TaxID=2747483 RepID=A0A8X7C5N3_9ARAC|nr:hypothetical protein TNIN_51911 [Trichonephila inaurata madagascariensis]
MRGLKDGSVARKPVPTFPDVRGQVEDIILGNRDAKLASDHLTQPETGATFNTPPRQCFNGRSLTGLHLSVSRKGDGCVSECPTHILDRVEA